MAQASRTFRIFVSSTFSDLKEERNALQKEVFPKLRELCMQHGCRFQAIDLRWGVREEAALDQQTMKICLDEIKRSRKTSPRPNFIVLLGDRYGWRPLPAEIPADEFEEILRCLPTDEKERQRRHTLLNQWYRRDDNAVPPVYCLLPREGEFKDFDKWEAVERELRSILLEAAIDEMLLALEKRLKYLASATEQEIAQAVLRVPDAQEHVFCFFRIIKGLPLDQSAKDFVDLVKVNGAYQPDTEARDRLERLKNRELRGRLPGNIYDYEAEWTGNGITTDHIAKLCEDVYQSLSRVIEKEIAQIEEVEPLDKEIADHDAFGKDRTKFFIGRAGILQTIADYVKGGDRHPLAVFGASGSGKSALMARAAEQARKDHPGAEIIVRFIGATPGSSDVRFLLRSLCEQIYEAFDYEQQKQQRLDAYEQQVQQRLDAVKGNSKEARRMHDEIEEEARRMRDKIAAEWMIPEDMKELPKTFRDFMTKVPDGERLVLFLDALDQLSDVEHARNLIWLPADLPEHVHPIVSTLPGECLSALEKKLPAANLVELEPMLLHEGSSLLDLWLDDAGRTLQDHQREEVLGKFRRHGLPLYLKLAFEEARRWKSHTADTVLKPDIPGVIRDLFARLSSDANHGKMLASRSLGYLAAAKNGLSEDELLDVLSLDEEVFQDFMARAYHKPPEQRLPVVVWSRLYFDLEPYLTERSAVGASLMAFYHRQFGEVVAKDYLAGDAKRDRHRDLARYFGDQPLQIEKDGKKTPNVRKVSELPYQQTGGEMWDELEQTLCDLRFTEAKCAAGMTYDLVEDCASVLDALPEAQEESQRERERDVCLARYTQELIAYAKSWNDSRARYNADPLRNPLLEPTDIPLPAFPSSVRPWTDVEIGEDTRKILNNPMRFDRIRASSQFLNAESHNLVKYGGWPGFCVQQAYNLMSIGPIEESASRIIHAPDFGEAILLRFPASRPVYNSRPDLLRILEGHSGAVTAVALTADGRRAVSGSWDNTLRVWDIESGRCLQILAGHSGPVHAVALTPDGRRAISGIRDMRVWDIESGQCLRILAGHSSKVNAVALTADGRLAISGSDDRTLRLWDTESGQCVQTIWCEDSIKCLALTPEGRRAISGGINSALQVWDIESGKCVQTLRGHSGMVESVALTPDGRRAISGGRGLDNTLRAWDIRSGQGRRLSRLLRKTTGRAVALTPDGRLAVLGCTDGTLSVWDIEIGSCVRFLQGHPGVNAVALTADGRFAVSGSDDSTLRVWDVERGQCLQIRKRDQHLRIRTGYSWRITALALAGPRVVSWTKDPELCIWEIKSGECVESLRRLHRGVNAIELTPDGQRIVSVDGGHTASVWDIKSGLRLKNLWTHYSGEVGLDEQRTWVEALVLTPDGRFAVSGSDDSTLRVWDVERGQCLQTFPHPNRISILSITPDGRAVVGSSGNTICISAIESGQRLQTLQGHTRKITALSLTQDGMRAVSGSHDTTLRVWDIKSGQCLQILRGHSGSITAVALTADGRLAVSGSIDNTVRVWDIEQGRCLALCPLPVSVSSLALRDGVLVVGDHSGNVLFFDMKNFGGGPPLVTAVRLWQFGAVHWWQRLIFKLLRFGPFLATLLFILIWLFPISYLMKRILQIYPGVIGTFLVLVVALTAFAIAYLVLRRLFDKGLRIIRFQPKGYWDEQITTVCDWCGQRFMPPTVIPDSIQAITHDGPPCLKLPAQAWDEPRLLSKCTHCHKPLKLNPFVVDNSQLDQKIKEKQNLTKTVEGSESPIRPLFMYMRMLIVHPIQELARWLTVKRKVKRAVWAVERLANEGRIQEARKIIEDLLDTDEIRMEKEGHLLRWLNALQEQLNRLQELKEISEGTIDECNRLINEGRIEDARRVVENLPDDDDFCAVKQELLGQIENIRSQAQYSKGDKSGRRVSKPR